MEEKRYPIFDEEQGVDICSEPVAEVSSSTPRSVDGMTAVHDRIDDLDWDKFPSYGPFSDEEAIARIKEAEKDLKDPSKWITAEELDRRLYERFPWLKTDLTEDR